ncbi:phage tail protein [Lapidilactobacillus wuchangensis]|uniref:phage tail protein n=1 Tax=Lapidilactobacillus wuchangensis TaxID=2486001 RepID=UPI000F76829B|nr:phage tail protein [Lapidilactobacillus wuchangensis]
MELKGLADFIIGLYGPDGTLLKDKDKGLSETGLYKVDLNSSKGATQANMTGLAPTVTKVYGSNAVAEQNIGTPSPAIALAANDIPHTIYDKTVGLEKDEVNTGYAARPGQTSMGGVIVHSQSADGTVDAYMAFPQGTITPGEMNLQTNTENPVSVHDALTLSTQARGSDKLMYQKFYSDEPNFDYEKMLAFIFPGYVAKTTSEAAQTSGSSEAAGSTPKTDSTTA